VRREQLELEVAQLYFARRRARLALEAEDDLAGREARALELDELTAILDSLTGGALTATEASTRRSDRARR
jgi:hypothetical protein